jgi:hypothetical protein
VRYAEMLAETMTLRLQLQEIQTATSRERREKKEFSEAKRTAKS